MESLPIITNAHLRHLEQHGWLKVPGLVSPGAASDAREFIYRKMNEAGFWTDGSWQQSDPEQVRKVIRSIGKSRRFKPLLDSEVLVAAARLCGGQRLIPTSPVRQLLFTAPFSSPIGPNPVTRWSVPASVWHTDCPRDRDPSSYGIQAFTFIDQVLPKGGGTLLISGSHRVREGRILGSKELKQSLRGERFWRKLTNKHIEDRSRIAEFAGEIDGIPLSLVELQGKPGDVYFTDLRILHSLTPNIRSRPRLMMTQRLPTESGLARIEDCLAELRQDRSVE